MLRWKPISPMSCDSGIQLSAMSRSLNAAASAIEAMLAHRLRWVSSTPLGSPVEPDEYWMKARSSGRAGRGCPGAPARSRLPGISA